MQSGGIAAIAVVYFHAGEHALKTGMPASAAETAAFVLLSDWFNLGKIAVLLFFGVSGFVIPFSINGTVSEDCALRHQPVLFASTRPIGLDRGGRDFLYAPRLELPAHVIAVNATMTAAVRRACPTSSSSTDTSDRADLLCDLRRPVFHRQLVQRETIATVRASFHRRLPLSCPSRATSATSSSRSLCRWR